VSTPQINLPVTIGGRPYLVEMDEFGSGAKVGAARIIDISDEKAPRVVSNLRLEVNQADAQAAYSQDPGFNEPFQGYEGHYCSVPQREDPGIVACTFILSGLRVFDIRDPLNPREIAYFNMPSKGDSFAMSSVAFAPERGEVWYSDGNTGFYALKLTNGMWPAADQVLSASDTQSTSDLESARRGPKVLPATGNEPPAAAVTLGLVGLVALTSLMRRRSRSVA
jgi:LPXTG-motif cell wall-anchored protein